MQHAHKIVYHFWFLYLGLLLMSLGILAILFSSVSSRIQIAYFGLFLILVGLIEGAHVIKMPSISFLILHLFMSILYIAAGILITIDPLGDEAIVTLLHALFFIACGVVRIIFSLEKQTPHRLWLFLNGALTLLIGFLVGFEWPESSLWVIGTLVGIDALMTGWTWIMLSLSKPLRNII